MAVGTYRIDRQLIELGLVSAPQIEEARLSSATSKRPVLDELIELGHLAEGDLVTAFQAANPGIEVIKLAGHVVDPSVLIRIPQVLAERYSALPIEVRDGELVVAMTNPWDIMATDDLAIAAGGAVRPVLAQRSELLEAIGRHYDSDSSAYDLYRDTPADEGIEICKREAADNRDVAELRADADTAPVIRLANLIISDALKVTASDIHVEPTSEQLIVRYRVDGVLRTALELPLKLTPALISRIKLLAGMDIAEHRKPQDGRIKVRWKSREVDIRASVVPTFAGEKAALRLLTFAGADLSLDGVGMNADDLDQYRKMIFRPQGMILVTGPTGSGKTSTIYASLIELNDGVRNITTVEDPVEYQLDGINQIQINEVAGVSFTSTLRSILRQDPNVIFVGEIRDFETAQIAFQSAQTGHLVISTLHTNSAVASYTRLLNLGVEPFLIASSILGIVAQRLVRKICPECKRPVQTDAGSSQLVGLRIPHGARLSIGEGCPACDETGFRGRTAVFEMLHFDQRLKKLAADARPEAELAASARAGGMQSLSERAVELALSGGTTLKEALASCPAEVARVPAGAAPHRGPGPKPEAQPGRSKPVALVVDDDAAARTLFDRTISQAGVQVHLAENGEQAVRMAHEIKPDIIILDVMMPVLDGIETCRQLKSSLGTAHIPVIMATAKSLEESEVEALRAGADDYLIKPVMPEKLRLHVLKHLRHKYPAIHAP